MGKIKMWIAITGEIFGKFLEFLKLLSLLLFAIGFVLSFVLLIVFGLPSDSKWILFSLLLMAPSLVYIVAGVVYLAFVVLLGILTLLGKLAEKILNALWRKE